MNTILYRHCCNVESSFLPGFMITQPLKRFMLRDDRQDIGCAKTECGNVVVYFVGFSIEMAVQDVNCVYLSKGE